MNPLAPTIFQERPFDEPAERRSLCQHETCVGQHHVRTDAIQDLPARRELRSPPEVHEVLAEVVDREGQSSGLLGHRARAVQLPLDLRDLRLYLRRLGAACIAACTGLVGLIMFSLAVSVMPCYRGSPIRAVWSQTRLPTLCQSIGHVVNAETSDTKRRRARGSHLL